MEALATQSVILEKLIHQENTTVSARSFFPLATEIDVQNLNSTISNENKNTYVRTPLFNT